MKRVILLVALSLLVSIQFASADGGKRKKKKESNDSPVPTMHPKAERNHHTVAKELKKGHSKSAKVKQASHEPKSGHSKAPKVKKPKKGKNYTKHDNYP